MNTLPLPSPHYYNYYNYLNRLLKFTCASLVHTDMNHTSHGMKEICDICSELALVETLILTLWMKYQQLKSIINILSPLEIQLSFVHFSLPPIQLKLLPVLSTSFPDNTDFINYQRSQWMLFVSPSRFKRSLQVNSAYLLRAQLAREINQQATGRSHDGAQTGLHILFVNMYSTLESREASIFLCQFEKLQRCVPLPIKCLFVSLLKRDGFFPLSGLYKSHHPNLMGREWRQPIPCSQQQSLLTENRTDQAFRLILKNQ